MQQKVVIINTGCANISSVRIALERLGSSVLVTDDANLIQRADKVLLPGVGSAGAAMRSIGQKDLIHTVQQLSQPVLGVCLGMQLMVEHSHESKTGSVACLNLIPGEVVRMQVNEQRLPHMGWNTVSTAASNALFQGIPDKTYFYFVHSFCVQLSSFTVACCEYARPFSAALMKDNFYGVQFHPERSGEAGAQLLRNFLTL
ncbi:imidazole glycerol phosphate synthase subunit HisH [Alteromonas sp. ASW11-130]|uniref:imidazole glycerol phosphate synthase subunit HisH n=1 Tax=Alteromonas sp. ASW11-130 TaxID=3015775 RepID=UPI00224289DD|nr:imidazole glycerol phosphate synthase subunit HisH [Alteromonas sp. ASW11-130]MCW8092523.1 imidazole glycerol phosphate synthase subunit HisH [Alteromonas sp. ASW11-130]